MKKYLNSLEKIDKIAFTIVGILLSLILINGCTPEIDVCEKGERNNGVVCTEIYQPVIAPDGTEAELLNLMRGEYIRYKKKNKKKRL